MEVAIQLLERVGRATRTIGLGPRGKRLADELPERRSLRAAEATQGMASMGDVSEHLLTRLSSLIGQQFSDFAERDPTVAAYPSVKGTHAGRLNSQRKSTQSGVINLEGLGRRLCEGACEQFRSDDGAHVSSSSGWCREWWPSVRQRL